MDIYLKPSQKVSITQPGMVRISHVAEVVADKAVTDKINHLPLMSIASPQRENYLITITDIVKTIHRVIPTGHVVNLGFSDICIQYDPISSRTPRWIGLLKIIFVSAVLFAGSSTAIMGFYSDADLRAAFRQYNTIFTGQTVEHPYWIEVPFAIGLSLGIVLFYNHFLGKKLTQDPTPLEVEMLKYDTEVVDVVVDKLLSDKIKEQ